jgi:hypothetical protein
MTARPPGRLQVSEVLEQWLALQRQWMYLEPVFSSPDILQQLPLEGKRFAAVDRSWRKTLDAAKKAPNVIKVRQGEGGGAEEYPFPTTFLQLDEHCACS